MILVHIRMLRVPTVPSTKIQCRTSGKAVWARFYRLPSSVYVDPPKGPFDVHVTIIQIGIVIESGN
jgi:hypothetical protein